MINNKNIFFKPKYFFQTKNLKFFADTFFRQNRKRTFLPKLQNIFSTKTVKMHFYAKKHKTHISIKAYFSAKSVKPHFLAKTVKIYFPTKTVKTRFPAKAEKSTKTEK